MSLALEAAGENGPARMRHSLSKVTRAGAMRSGTTGTPSGDHREPDQRSRLLENDSATLRGRFTRRAKAQKIPRTKAPHSTARRMGGLRSPVYRVSEKIAHTDSDCALAALAVERGVLDADTRGLLPENRVDAIFSADHETLHRHDARRDGEVQEAHVVSANSAQRRS